MIKSGHSSCPLGLRGEALVVFFVDCSIRLNQAELLGLRVCFRSIEPSFTEFDDAGVGSMVQNSTILHMINNFWRLRVSGY